MKTTNRWTRRHRLLTGVSLLLVICTGSHLRADDSSAILDAVLNEREKIKEFHFIAIGLIGRQQEGEYEVWSSGESMRCDFVDKRGLKTEVLMNPESSYLRANNSDVLRIDRKAAQSHLLFFEVNAIGLGLYGEIERCYSASELVRSMQREKELLQLRELLDGKVELQYGPFPLGEIRRFIIDPANHFAVLLCREDYPESCEEPHANQNLRVSWIDFNGVSVPKNVKLVRGEEVDRDFEIEWISLGKPIPQDVFDPKKVFASSKMFVTKINDRLVGERIDSGNSANPTRSTSSSSNALMFFLAAFVGAVSYVMIRRLRQKGHSSVSRG